jgi:hypothetical protein
MKSGFFSQLRERQKVKNARIELDRAEHEFAAAGTEHQLIVARGKRAVAALNFAEATGATPDQMTALAAEASAAAVELQLENDRGNEDNSRSIKVILQAMRGGE